MLFNKQISAKTCFTGRLRRDRLHNSRQQGFVLILALVMLTVLTLIGLSSMNSANMELKSTANAQQHQVAFNAVISTLEFGVSRGSDFNFQPDDLLEEQTIVDYALPDSPASQLFASMAYAGCNAGIGSSIEDGFSYNFFNIAGSGANATETATSMQAQGVRYPSASCDPTLIPILIP